MMDIDTLVGRLMELETKFYELQDRYHTLINDYEQLKEKSEKHCKSGCDWCLLEATQESLREHMALVKKLKEQYEDCARHRNQHGTRYDTLSGDTER